MNATYEHMVAIILVGAIFVGTVVAMPATMSFNTFDAVDQQQLRNITLNVFNAILLGTGSPSKWGSIMNSTKQFDQDVVKTFGLASTGTFSTYVLDVDKVQRIDVENSESIGYIDYARTRELLNLEGYGFQFSLFRPFTVESDIDWNDQDVVHLSVSVTRTEDGTPIPNAIVKASFIGTATNKTDKYSPVLVSSNTSELAHTDVLGKAEIFHKLIVQDGTSLDKAIAVMHIIVAGMETMVMASKDKVTTDCLKIATFGDTITLSFNDQEFYNATETPNGERKIKFMYGYDLESSPLMLLHAGDNKDVVTQGQGYDTWTRTFPGLTAINPAMLVFIVSVPIVDQGGGENGRQLVMLAGPFSFDSSNKIFHYGAEKTTGLVIATMRRYVLISGMTYVSEIIVWKE